jgi:hypothetical protein
VPDGLLTGGHYAGVARRPALGCLALGGASASGTTGTWVGPVVLLATRGGLTTSGRLFLILKQMDSKMPSIKGMISALDSLRRDAGELHDALLKHERVLAAGRLDAGHAELHSLVHRMARLLGDLKLVLNEPVPA